MRDSDKLRGPNNGLPIEPKTKAALDDPRERPAEEEPLRKIPEDWSGNSMWDRVNAKPAPARPNPLFEPQTQTISLSPQQAQRCLAAQLAAGMLTNPGKPFQPGHHPSSADVITLAEWIMKQD